MSLHYYIIDVETTGLKANFHEMTEIGVIRCTDRVQLHRKIKCEYPERASFDALKITGKTLADLEHGFIKEDVVKEVEKFMSEDEQQPNARCIVAHNGSFDRKFLHALWASCGKTFPAALWLDTMALTKEFVKKADVTQLDVKKTATGKISYNLHAACDIVGIKKLSDAHNAKVDSRNTYLLWKKLVDDGIDQLPLIKSVPHVIEEAEELTLDDVG